MVTATHTPTLARPAADEADITVAGRSPCRPDGLFVRPEVAAAAAAGHRRPRRASHPMTLIAHRLLRLLSELRFPPPLVDTSLQPRQTRLGSAAAIGERMRRRDDRNP